MRSLARRGVAEAIGTYALVLIGTGAVMVDAVTNGAVGALGIAAAFGAVITAMVFALGHVSGAHLNPAVTLGLWSTGRFPGGDVAPYLVGQCAGAIAASFTLRGLLGEAGGLGATLPSSGLLPSLAVEGILSFLLMFVIISVTTDDRVTPGFPAIPIGLAVGFGVLVGGPLSGPSMNPARSLGPAVAGEIWAGHWIYWLGPVLGMLVAVRAYEFLRPAGTFQDVPAPLGVEGPVPAADAPDMPRQWRSGQG